MQDTIIDFNFLDISNKNLPTRTLEELMNAGSDSTLQVIGFGYDSFSGTRKVFESKIYTINDIKLGKFDKNSLNILQNGAA